jgi:hypothetical protein
VNSGFEIKNLIRRTQRHEIPLNEFYPAFTCRRDEDWLTDTPFLKKERGFLLRKETTYDQGRIKGIRKNEKIEARIGRKLR